MLEYGRIPHSLPQVERYTLEARIDHGGQADVYLGEHIGLGKKVAIKILSERWVNDEICTARFVREATVMATIEHSGIVKVSDIGKTTSLPFRPFFVMDLMEGSLLNLLAEHGPMTAKDACNILLQILAALGHLHSKGVIHRDVKSANCLFRREEGRIIVKLGDFGILRSDQSTIKTNQGVLLGSVHYMSPEQTSQQSIGTQSDLYSVGILMFELLIGGPPFLGSDEEIMQKHCKAALPSICSAGFAGPPAKKLDAIVRRALAKNPRDRFQTAAEFSAAIEDAMAEDPKKPRIGLVFLWKHRYRWAMGAALGTSLALISGTWRNTRSLEQGVYTVWGSPGHVPLLGDLDGDGTDDLLAWNPSSRRWLASRTDNSPIFQAEEGPLWGVAGDIPLVGDLDGDSIVELVQWRPSVRKWYAITANKERIFPRDLEPVWGAAGDRPALGDLDGDGRAEMVTWRPANGCWYALKTDRTPLFEAGAEPCWGTRGDVPMLGDVDGDKIDDMIIWRPSDGRWYTRRVDGTPIVSEGLDWNMTLAIPLVGDLDADGHIDAVFWHPREGAWRLQPLSLLKAKSRSPQTSEPH